MSGKRDKKKSSKKSSKSKRREKEVDGDKEGDAERVLDNSGDDDASAKKTNNSKNKNARTADDAQGSDDDDLSRDRKKRSKKGGAKKDKKRDKKSSSRKAGKGEEDEGEGEGEDDGDEEGSGSDSAKNKSKKNSKKDGKKKKKNTDDRKNKKSRGRKGTSDGAAADSDEEKAASLAAAAEKKLGARVNLVKEAKETFAELQARRATNMQRCRLALSLAAVLGGICVVVGAGLYIAFGFVGRCTDPDLPYDCGSFECCPTACNSTDDVALLGGGEGSTVDGGCSLVIANPVEISGIVLLIVGWIAIVVSLVCFVQVNRVAQMEIPASAFGAMLVVALVLILAAIVGFIVAGVAVDSSSSSSSSSTTDTDTNTNTVSLPQGFLILALTTVWPGALLLIISLVGLHITWQSQATLKRRKVLVLGLSGAGKSLVVSGLLTAAEKSSGGREASGTVQNFSGKPTNGFLTQSVTRSDGHSLEFTETGGVGLSQLMRSGIAEGTNAIVFVVDACDKSRLQEAGLFLERLYALPVFWGLPLLVVGNKSGRWNAIPAQSLVDALNLHVVRDRHWYFVPCSATHDSAKRFEDGLEWLCEELEVPKELEVQHPNVMVLAFPCLQQASDSGGGAEPRSAAATQSAAAPGQDSAELVSNATPAAEGKTTETDPEAASRSESKSLEGKFADAV